DYEIWEISGGVVPTCLQAGDVSPVVKSDGNHRASFTQTVKAQAPLFVWNRSKSGRYTLVADGYSQAVPSAATAGLGTLSWEITAGNNLNCQIDPSTGIVTASTNTGTIVVKATAGGSTCYEEML